MTDRLNKSIPDYRAAPADLLDRSRPANPPLKWHAADGLRPFQAAVFCRLLFSCLVDADFLATEAFMREILPDAGAITRLGQRTYADNRSKDYFA